ncbi:MAG: M55 family metallopeptidase [Candidatus Latescibacterota bacterium]
MNSTKGYVQGDMERVCGVMTEDQIFPERKHKACTEARSLMTEEVNATLEGALAGMERVTRGRTRRRPTTTLRSA